MHMLQDINLNDTGNLTDFILYLKDKGVIEIKTDTNLFNMQDTVENIKNSWILIAQEVLQ